MGFDDHRVKDSVWVLECKSDSSATTVQKEFYLEFLRNNCGWQKAAQVVTIPLLFCECGSFVVHGIPQELHPTGHPTANNNRVFTQTAKNSKQKLLPVLIISAIPDLQKEGHKKTSTSRHGDRTDSDSSRTLQQCGSME
jgi:hypothetical protein